MLYVIFFILAAKVQLFFHSQKQNEIISVNIVAI